MDTTILSNLSEGHLMVGGVALIVLTVVLAVLKGIVRILLGVAGLIMAAVAFWFTFRNGSSIASGFMVEPGPWIPFWIASVSALFTYVVVRHGLGLACKPLFGAVEAMKNQKLIAGLLGVVIAGFGLYGFGSASQQLDAMHFLSEQKKGEEMSWLNQMLAKTQESWFGDFQQKTDPTHTGFRCDLVKLLSLANYSGSTVRADELQALLKRPEISGLLKDPEISKALQEGDFQTLFRNEKLSQVLKSEENKELLQNLDWRKILGS